MSWETNKITPKTNFIESIPHSAKTTLTTKRTKDTKVSENL